MNQKQFGLFQSAVQWILDEKRASEKGRKHDPVWHKQQLWGSGLVTKETIDPFQCLGTRYDRLMKYSVVCPSSACLAGNITLIHGDKMVVPNVDYTAYEVGQVTSVDFCIDDQQRVHPIASRARELIGVTEEEAIDLFAAGNSRNMVIAKATAIAEKYGYEMELV